MSVREQPGTADTLEGGAVVVWLGDLKDGQGRLRLGLEAGGELPLRWPGSDAYGPGVTSPEELAAAAHAACFTMTLAYTLMRERHPAREIESDAKTTFGVASGVRAIRRSELVITVDADGLSDAQLAHAAELAGRYCPVSNSFRAAGVELDVRSRLAPARA
jgi:osmotically inducible protein OsmC